jgi:hypothetical protein
MTASQGLNIYYEGNSYKDGKIDIKEFAPSLLAFGELIEESNQAINNKKAEIKTYITADFEKKCFKCKLSLESSNILQSAKNLFGLKETLNIQELLELLGFLGTGTAGTVITSYVAYKLIEKGRKVKKHTILQDGNVELAIDETTVTVEFNLFKLIKTSWQKKSSIHKNFEKHLTSKGEIGYSNKGDDNITKITKEYKDAILAPDQNRERPEASQDPIRTNLTIRVVDFLGDQKWTFMYAGKTLRPEKVEYPDQIKEKLKELSKSVKYNSKLPVEMIITYEADNNGEAIEGTEKYKIQQITGDLIQEVKQESIFDNNS